MWYSACFSAADHEKVQIQPRAKPARRNAPAPAIQYPRRYHAGTDSGNGDRSAEPLRNRLEQRISAFSKTKSNRNSVQFSSEDAPLSIGIVFDSSGSMGNKLEKSRQAVAQFFKTANPEDEFFLVSSTTGPNWSAVHHNLEEIQNRLTFTQSKGRTALLDGIYMAMNEMKKAKNPRKALLVISDGGDNSSRYTESEIKNLVKEADVQIYAIGIYEPDRPAAGRPRNCPDPVC